MMKSIYLHTLAIVLALLMCVGLGWGLEWSEPIELTDAREERLDTEFDVAVDSHGNCHLVYQVMNYNQERGTERVLYSVFDAQGNPIIHELLPLGPDREAYYAKMIIDRHNHANFLCIAENDDGITGYWFTCIDLDGNYITQPIIIEGLAWSSEYFDFFESEEGFVFSTLSLGYDEEDRPFNTIFYARFDSSGDIIGEPHNLYTDRDSEENFYRLKASLDEDDNLHFVWRSATVNNETNRVAYACVDRNDEFVQEWSWVPARENQVQYGCNRFFARNLDEIYLLMIDSGVYPYNDYVQCMNADCETQWITTVLEQPYLLRTIDMSTNGNEITIIGSYAPDTTRTLWYYHTGIDLDGEVTDSLEVIKQVYWRDQSGYPKGINKNEEVYLFYKHNYEALESSIMLIKGTESNHSVLSPLERGQRLSGFVAYPNPFNFTTTLCYSLPVAENVSVAVYDLSGREVARLVDGVKLAGNHQVTWSADGVGSGVYVVALDAGGVMLREKVVLVK